MSAVSRFRVTCPEKAELLICLGNDPVAVVLHDGKNDQAATLCPAHLEGDGVDIHAFGTTVDGMSFNLRIPIASADEPTVALLRR